MGLHVNYTTKTKSNADTASPSLKWPTQVLNDILGFHPAPVPVHETAESTSINTLTRVQVNEDYSDQDEEVDLQDVNANLNLVINDMALKAKLLLSQQTKLAEV